MNLQKNMQPRTSSNGFNHRRIEKDMADRIDNKSQSGKFNPSGVTDSSGGTYYEIPSRDRLVYISTCLIGLNVEVHVKNGSIFSGIFHAINTDKDFGIILKMAHLIKDTSSRGHRAATDTVTKAPSKTQIILAQELVQIIAKDVPLTKEGLRDELQHEKQELLLDSYISKSRHMEEERQLKRWVPDEDDPHCPELENIFDNPRTGSWDQFKVNENLYGVKSTFNEELYTTKLPKGPHMRKIEEEALRIAREIEGEDTHDLHLAEERGRHGNYDIDEETRYSSVFRGIDDSGFADEEAMMDTHNDDTFGDSPSLATGRSFADVTSGKIHDEDRVLSSTSSMDDLHSSQSAIRELSPFCSQLDEHSSKSCNAMEHDLRIKDNHISEEGANDSAIKQVFDEEPQTTRTADMQAALNLAEGNSAKRISFAESTVCSVSDRMTKVKQETSSASSDLKENAGAEKVHVASYSKSPHGRPSSSVSSTLERRGPTLATSSPALSPSSSMSSLSSEKSTLNPNAKEFKFNPNAKSFSPSKTPIRPLSPVAADDSYFPPNIPAVQPMHGMHVGVGVGPSFPGPHPMMFKPPGVPMQPPHMYFPPNGPQYGQPMGIHPRQVTYMPSYPTVEMPYKRREF